MSADPLKAIADCLRDELNGSAPGDWTGWTVGQGGIPTPTNAQAVVALNPSIESADFIRLFVVPIEEDNVEFDRRSKRSVDEFDVIIAADRKVQTKDLTHVDALEETEAAEFLQFRWDLWTYFRCRKSEVETADGHRAKYQEQSNISTVDQFALSKHVLRTAFLLTYQMSGCCDA